MDAQALASEQTEFERIFFDHYKTVLGVLIRIVGERGTAEDLANEAFLRLHRQPPQAAAWKNPAGWLFTTATRLGVDAIRAWSRRSRYESAAADVPPEHGTPLGDVLREEQAGRVRRVLALLKPRDAQMLLMRNAGASYQELGEGLGMNVNSVGTSLARAEAAFKEHYVRLFGWETPQ